MYISSRSKAASKQATRQASTARHNQITKQTAHIIKLMTVCHLASLNRPGGMREAFTVLPGPLWGG